MENNLEEAVRQESERSASSRTEPGRIQREGRLKGRFKPEDLPSEIYQRLREKVIDVMRDGLLIPSEDAPRITIAYQSKSSAPVYVVPPLTEIPKEVSVLYDFIPQKPPQQTRAILNVSPAGERDKDVWKRHVEIFRYVYDLDIAYRESRGMELVRRPFHIGWGEFPCLIQIQLRDSPPNYLDIGMYGRVHGNMKL